MRRWRRILVELLGPPLIASVLFVVTAAVLMLEPKGLVLLPIVLVVAYPTAAIPSVVFTLALELSFARGLDPASGHAVRLAALLGTLCGALVALTFTRTPEKALEAVAIFPALGAATGLVIGAFVRQRSRRARPLPGAGEGAR